MAVLECAPFAGCIAGPKETLRKRLSKCYFLQRWAGNEFSEEELYSRIYLDALPRAGRNERWCREDYEALRPYVLIWSEGVIWNQDSAPNGYSTVGTLRAWLTENVVESEENDPELIDLQFDSLLGLTIQSGDQWRPGLVEIAQKEGQVHFQMSTDPEGSFRTPDEQIRDKGDAINHILEFQWGVPA